MDKDTMDKLENLEGHRHECEAILVESRMQPGRRAAMRYVIALLDSEIDELERNDN